MKQILFGGYLLFSTQLVLAQLSDSTNKEIEQVVVTATRTEKKEKDIAVPMALIDGKQIQLSGLTRLNEILAEQTGLTLVTNNGTGNHGTGIQIQGFDPAYTMVLIDGEPLLGRTGGTLELSRISLRNVKRIEILKGGSSCMYGSEAMGGVLNIITYPPSEQLTVGAYSRFGSFNTLDVGGDASAKTGKVGWYISGNRFSTKGYDLLPNAAGTTVAPYSNYTGLGKLYFPLGRSWEAKLSGRFFFENQQPSLYYSDNLVYSQRMTLTDGNFTASAEKTTRSGWTFRNRFYGSNYKAVSTLKEEGETTEERSGFLQRFYRLETNTEKALNMQHLINAGIGAVNESLLANRYSGNPSFNSAYAFFQHDWKPVKKLNIVSGLRFDHHGAFGNQLSPKLSVIYKVVPRFRLKASLGSGFKAPDFRQLYLNFTNPLVGYSVFGTRTVHSEIEQLEQQGIVRKELSTLAQVNTLQAERSYSFNAGFVLDLTPKTELSVNAFQNNISHLIETLPVAEKTNGQFIYSYVNLNRVVTRGIEANLKARITPSLQLTGGYQYLEAYDLDVLKQIDKGELFLKDPNSNRTVKMERRFYKGLLNRSPHTGNLKLAYHLEKAAVDVSIRWIYRSKYGFSDLNGNLVLDITDEFVPGYSQYNASISKQLKSFSIQLTLENIANYKQPKYIPSLPGRQIHLGINWKLNS